MALTRARVGTPSSPGGLVPMSRSCHPQGDMAVTIMITIEGRFSTLTAPFEAEESPEQPLKCPDPSHPGWGMGLWNNGGRQKLRSSSSAQLGTLSSPLLKNLHKFAIALQKKFLEWLDHKTSEPTCFHKDVVINQRKLTFKNCFWFQSHF